MPVLAELPIRSIRSKPLIPYKYMEHYLLAAYGSIETWTQKIVVVDESVSTPTALVSPQARRATGKNTMAYLVPSVDAVTGDVAAIITGVQASFFELREWSGECRRRGSMNLPEDTPSIVIREERA